jgi:hypothetical protein
MTVVDEIFYPPLYTKDEKTDMILIYGGCKKKNVGASCIYLQMAISK